MDDVVYLLQLIPATFWSGVVGALIALAGVTLSNRGNTERLRIQLEHDALEKAKERTVAVRREVYLSVIEELQKANSHLAQLPSLDPTTVNVADGMQGFFSAAARLQLVAEPTTASLASSLVNEYGGAIFELMALLQPAHKAKSDIKISDHHYNLALKETNRVNAEMTSLNESGNPDPLKMKALGATFKFQSEQMEKYAADSAAAWSRFNATNTTYQTSILSMFADLVTHQLPLLSALRQDLGISGDLSMLEKQLQGQIQQTRDGVDKFIATLAQTVNIGEVPRKNGS